MRTAFLILLLSAFARAETVRFAVVVGNNAGRGQLPPLRYAETDAGKFARVLLELGDVAPGHLHLLQGRAVRDVENALQNVRQEIELVNQSPDNRAVVLFYFSGHSDGEAIELGNEMLSYSRLKSILANVGDVRVVVIDACKSGAGFREKGGKPAEPFAIRLTDSLQSTGDAFISSSAESEAALESNEVLGSIFTHHFVSGLRGVADTSGDRLVTLGEAYRYAYDQTVSRTVILPAGAQHPSYDYKLAGQGELVLSMLERSTARLVLPPDVERAVVTDVFRDQVIAEVPSAAGREIAVPPGQYGLRLFKSGNSFGGRVTVADGGRREVNWGELKPISAGTRVASKGLLVTEKAEPSDDWQEDRLASLAAGIVPSIAPLGLQVGGRIAFEPKLSTGLSFALWGGYVARGSVAETTVEARAGWRFAWRRGPVWLGAGAEIGPAFIWQYTGTQLLFSPAGLVTPRAIVRILLGRSFLLSAEGEAGLAVFGISGGGVGVAFRPSGTIGIGFRF